ncbi:MAG: histidine--tRNA ligase [Candidatus Nitrosocaldaceae archaeon]|nr:MAG: histidine--tRNA ligase [Candidatus Nitrosocaldaceae archaeon]
MKFELPRGIRDIEPDEYNRINYLRDIFLDTAKLFDFKIMEPSPIEMLATLEAKSGPMIKNEIYAFKDKSNRDIALRFDLTVGITRYVTSRRELSIPAKFGSFAGVWRYDEPQLGRYRWFHQWDIEIYDNFNTESDAEVIEFTEYFMNKIGLTGIRIEINDREMLENYLKGFGVNDIDEYFRAIDKASKKSEEELLEEYSMLDSNILEQLLALSKESITLDRLKELKMDCNRIEQLLDSLKSRDVKNVKINLGIVRGLDYYSSIVFEVFSNESKNAIVGGGRYDKLPKIFNRDDLGATGAAGGIERILSLLKEGKKEEEKVYVAYTHDKLKNNAISLASILRKKNIIASSELGKRSLRKQMDYALKNNFTKVIILAEREYYNNKIILRDLSKKEEEMIDINAFMEKPWDYIKP